jgi:hypothetical protein
MSGQRPFWNVVGPPSLKFPKLREALMGGLDRKQGTSRSGCNSDVAAGLKWKSRNWTGCAYVLLVSPTNWPWSGRSSATQTSPPSTPADAPKDRSGRRRGLDLVHFRCSTEMQFNGSRRSPPSKGVANWRTDLFAVFATMPGELASSAVSVASRK